MSQCEKCHEIRKQRDGYICELVDLRKKYDYDVAELRQRIDLVSQDKYTRDDELSYITYDLESLLFHLGHRESTEPANYGAGKENLFGTFEYIRDIIQANYNFYKRMRKQ